MSGNEILLVARQAGTANAFSVLADELRRRRGRDVEFVASDQAAKVLKARPDVRCAELDDVLSTLSSTSVDVVVTGTSFEPEIDGAVWTRCRELDLPHLAYVDGWTNYVERFSIARPFDTTPSHVAVTDDEAAEQLISSGLPMRPVVVGNPAWDSLADVRPRANSHTVVLATEPIASSRGFAPTMVAEAVSSAVGRLGEPWRLLIKPHPREDLHEYFDIASAHRCVEVTDERRLALLAAARAVVGITTMFQVEARLVGLPVLSVQPGGRHFTELVSERRGIEIVERLEEVSDALRRTVSRPIEAPSVELSAPRFASLVESLLP